MNKIYVLILFVVLCGLVLFLTSSLYKNPTSPPPPKTQNETVTTQMPTEDSPQTTVVAQNLDTPWAIAFLPDKSILVTERQGQVRFINSTEGLDTTPVATIASVREIGEGGLLGITLHPDFSSNNFVYFYYTYSSSGNNTLNRVVRMKYQNKKLTNEEIIVDRIPGASNHNGGRIKFGPDNFLYIATGDAQEPSLAQNKNSLAGKILRVTDTGKAAPGNPFNNRVYSYGHRNVQGLAWSAQNELWATEHGRSGIQSGLDELNVIEAGKNYGWPTIEGDKTKPGLETPRRNSGNTTWAPAGAAFVDKTIFFGGLRGQTLYGAVIQNGQVTNFKEHFNSEYGRIREVILGPDNMIYLTTSNRDGRGTPDTTDDKVVKINPNKL